MKLDKCGGTCKSDCRHYAAGVACAETVKYEASTLTAEGLKQWCHQSREYLDQPWSAGDFTYATDGAVLIRIPRLAGVVSPTPPGVDLSKAYPSKDPIAWIPIPDELPEPVECEQCNGNPQSRVCPECDGEGDVEVSNSYSSYGVECATCDGAGTIGECRHCSGTGKVMPLAGIEFGPTLLNPKYLLMLKDLPNCEIGPTGSTTPALFRFDGCDGRLMPLRPGSVKRWQPK